MRDREISVEQEHLDRVYRRLEEKIHEAEFLMNDAAKRGQVGTPGALAERDAQVFRAGIHLNRLNNEFEDFLFGRIDLLLGKDGKKGPDGAYTAVEPAEGAVRDDGTADIAETLHIGRIGVLDSEYAPLVIDWRAPAAAPFYRSTPVDPGRVVRRRVIRSKGRRVLGVEDDLMRPELKAFLDGGELAVIGDGALMAALGQARSHTMRDIVASIQAEQDLVIRAPAASVTYVEGGPGTGKTAVALHRAAYLLYQDRRRYSGGILIVSPTPLLVAYTEGVLPSLGEEGQVAIRAIGSLVDGAEATLYDSPSTARAKGSYRMLRVLRKAARGALELGPAGMLGGADGSGTGAGGGSASGSGASGADASGAGAGGADASGTGTGGANGTRSGRSAGNGTGSEMSGAEASGTGVGGANGTRSGRSAGNGTGSEMSGADASGSEAGEAEASGSGTSGADASGTGTSGAYGTRSGRSGANGAGAGNGSGVGTAAANGRGSGTAPASSGSASATAPTQLSFGDDGDGESPAAPAPVGPPTRLRVVAFGRRLELEAAELERIRRNALGGTAPVNLLRPRARKLLLDALWAQSGAATRHTDPELAAELRSSFDEDVTSEDSFIAFLDAWWPELTPRAVLAAMADERRLGRWARRILNPGEVRRVARSLRRDGHSVHDIAMLDELQAILGTPARPRKKRELDPLDQLTGLEELMPVREESQRERAERLAQERTEYAHVIVDEAQDLTPMQWRMVGRRGRHATWTVVGDPAQSSWSDPDEAAEARDEALGTRPRRRFELTVNYRNPAEIAELAAKVLALAMPGSKAPSAVRSTGVEPRFTVVQKSLGETVRAEAARLLDLVDGTVGVVVAMQRREEAARWLAGLGERVVALGSLEAKGLEYDATVVVSPAEIADESPAGLRVLYVALTRATQQLTVVSADRDQPDGSGVPDLLRD
ncbi:UvrD-helicase domain-containing protein [Streptomyces cylindrosporus]|uniref:UvrD-helicase domain-containing protein n=1 Tax=Streptomyces cylindrosporus TaxID=2927583 RepID=UPI0027E2BEB9|nr:UvrD-helicase domain-containing protein [Streptomyces cylindrosporus]